MVPIEEAQSMSVKSLQKTVERQYREIVKYEQLANDFGLDVTRSDKYHQMTEHWCRLTDVLRGKMDPHEYLHFMDELMAVTDTDGTDSRGLPKRQPGATSSSNSLSKFELIGHSNEWRTCWTRWNEPIDSCRPTRIPTRRPVLST